jgi:OHCU decarboxylase
MSAASSWCRSVLNDGLARFNEASTEEAVRLLHECFANRGWAASVAAGRPYADLSAVLASAESAWSELMPAEWLEAFAAHPRIGERGGHSPAASEREQSQARQASAATLAALAADNRDYEARFGHVFLISASGRTAEEMLGELRRRMSNGPAAELQVAADEHRKITRLRLEHLLKT